MVKRMVLIVAVLIAMLSESALAQDEFNYVKRDTRDATRDATLSQYVPTLDWRPWWVIGPFDNTGMDKHDVVYPAEVEFDREATYAGKDGRPVSWQELDQPFGLPVNLKIFGDEEDNLNGIAYLYREVVSDQATTLTVEMGSDDGLKFWFNGELLVDADLYRGLSPSDHRLTLDVKEGVNTVLVKVTQGVGGWEYQIQTFIDSRLLARLEYHLDRDFPVSPEALHYQMLSVLEPDDVALEVGGLDVMPDGRPIVATRRGDVFIVDGAYDDPPFDATFTRFATGLHEPLGARWRDGGVILAQRGELTKVTDEDGDGVGDFYETLSDAWGISGNYHEYAFGPKYDNDGRTWVTLNVGFCGSMGKSIVPWRGWAVIVDDDGTLTPVCGGLRSPNGLGRNVDGEMFYTDNQGDWVETNKLSHLSPGDWHGHPSSTGWYESADMPTPNTATDYKVPAVWFPYDRMGRSASDIELDTTGGAFGPFQDQLFVGDQYSAIIMRVFLEQVGGEYQGACFPFLEGLDCGVNRLRFAPDGSLFVGMTNRGWWSYGQRPWGLQRVVYTGVEPFEMHEVRAMPNGFEITFTDDVDVTTVEDVSSWSSASFRHEHREQYGSPEIDQMDHRITRIDVAEDQRSCRIVLDGFRAGYVYEIHAPGVRNTSGAPLLHPDAYYTLNRRPTN
ncbi:MAG: hypothetical protein AAF432_06900 [Planctomycetota bacterium]